MTFSLVACDLERAEWGVAVQSKFLAVGAVVPYAAAGIGAVATQAYANLRYGPEGLALLRDGVAADDVVRRLVATDNGRDQRQVGVVDRIGRAATYTGSTCSDWAGGRTGHGYAAQGNILVSEATVAALADRFEATEGSPLAERLLVSLAEAQNAGGDSRGQQSASLVVVRDGAGYGGGSDVLVDLRVDDHPEPIQELERLFRLHQLLFGQTPADEWLDVGPDLAREIRMHLDRRGFASGDLGGDLETWAGIENLEERVEGVERIDPVVLDQLRQR